MHHPTTLGNHPNNLPVSLTSLIGREREVQTIHALPNRGERPRRSRLGMKAAPPVGGETISTFSVCAKNR